MKIIDGSIYADVISSTWNVMNTLGCNCGEAAIQLDNFKDIMTTAATRKEINNTMANNNFNFLNGMFGNIRGDMCRLSIDGKVAIHTSNGYKTYDVDTGSCVNCNNFVFGDDSNNFFFLIPTNHVVKGDIIIAGGKPRCVIAEEKDGIKTFCYEDSSISTIVPEHHFFLGKTYFYGKIVSLFGNGKSDKSSKNLMKFMLMNQMLGGNKSYGNTNANGMNPMMMMFMMNGNMGSMFDDMLDFNFDHPKNELVGEENNGITD